MFILQLHVLGCERVAYKLGINHSTNALGVSCITRLNRDNTVQQSMHDTDHETGQEN